MATLGAAAATLLVTAGSSLASGVTVTDLDRGASATGLAEALAGPGVTVSNVTYTGANRAAGSFTGGTGNVGIGGGILLSSGKVQTYGGDAPDASCGRGVEGPNDCNEATEGNSNSTTFATAGDSDLDSLVQEGTTNDASVLTFDFVPQQTTVRFRYVFSSEEYNDYVNSSFNDVFGFFVNGTNCALVPGAATPTPVSINTINNGPAESPGENASNPHLFRDNVRPTPGSIDTQMDGLTTVLTCTATVSAGVTNTMKLAIADTSDTVLDSVVFLEAGSLVSGQPLTVVKAGGGTGTVTSSPAGIDCGTDCSEAYADSTVVTLSATPTSGSSFAGWSGACTGTGTCEVTMSEARSVTATFDASTAAVLTVTKAGSGSGTVTSSPAGIDCGTDCSEAYAESTVVTLSATPAAGSTFTGWSGACTGTGACEVTMDQARAVTATFALDVHGLTVSRSGAGSGTVTSSPAGIDCGTDCAQSYDHGTTVTLTATPAAGSTFTGWSGACTGTGTCQVTMDQARSVTATFAVATHELGVAKSGTGSGAVSSSPAGIDCGTDCAQSYDHGTTVTLTATPAAGSTFTGWSGACTGTGTCQVTMDQARAVTATFTLLPETDVDAPPKVDRDGLFCGRQHRGRCTGLKIKGVFDRPGNAVWTFDAFNPTPGNTTASQAARKRVRLGKVERTVDAAGTVKFVFKLKKGRKTARLYRKVKNRNLTSIRVRQTFTSASGRDVEKTTVKLKR